MMRSWDQPGEGQARLEGHAERSERRASAKDRALGLLAVRWRSREEIRRRLRRAGYEPEEIEAAVRDLESAGLIEDQRFAAEVVRDQATRRLAGARAIRAALREKGVTAEVIERAVADAGDEEARAHDLATRRAQRLGSLAPEAAYRKLVGLLLRRGYPSGLAREAAARALRDAFDGADLPD